MQNDVETIKRLKELRDNNTVTQEEFDELVASYLNPADKAPSVDTKPANTKDSTPARQGGGALLRLVIFGIIIYIFVETVFPSSIQCKDDATAEQCNCVKQAVATNVNFIDKVRILLMGASREELIMYGGSKLMICGFM